MAEKLENYSKKPELKIRKKTREEETKPVEPYVDLDQHDAALEGIIDVALEKKKTEGLKTEENDLVKTSATPIRDEEAIAAEIPAVEIVIEEEPEKKERIAASRRRAVEKMTPEEKIGELELNLKNRYKDLFADLKEKKEPGDLIIENIQKDQNELALAYEPEIRTRAVRIFEAVRDSLKGDDKKAEKLLKEKIAQGADEAETGYFKKELYAYKKILKSKNEAQTKDNIFRKELGAIFQNIKQSAFNEVNPDEKNKKRETEPKKPKGASKKVRPVAKIMPAAAEKEIKTLATAPVEPTKPAPEPSQVEKGPEGSAVELMKKFSIKNKKELTDFLEKFS